jgi:hypothetical protein
VVRSPDGERRRARTASFGADWNACILALAKRGEETHVRKQFPGQKIGTGYAMLWNAFKRIAGSASSDEKRDLLANTARRFHRLAQARIEARANG